MAIHRFRDDVAHPEEPDFWPSETDSVSHQARLAMGALVAAALLAIAAAFLFGDDDTSVETVANQPESAADDPPQPTPTTVRATTTVPPTTAPTAEGSLLPVLPSPTADGRPADDPAAPDTSSTTSSTTAPPSTAAPTTAAPSPVSCNNPWGDLEGCGWPGRDNTGPRSANCPNGLAANGSSTTGRAVTITEDNAVISCQRFSGTVVIQAKNVTIRDSTVTVDGQGGNGGGAIVVNDGGTATIEHVEIDGLGRSHACVWHQGEGVTVDAMECRGMVDGLVAWARTEYSPTAGDNFTLRNSYLHSFTHDASNGHIDGFQTLGATNGLIEGNVFDIPASGNSAVAIWNTRKNASNIRVIGNLMTGGQFTVYAQDNHPSTTGSGGNTVSNITFTDNRFSTRADVCVGDWGPWYHDTGLSYDAGPSDGWKRSGNIIIETGQNVDGGNHTCR
ncbi:MAG: hypothetical protein AAGD35_12235 [Actinomycetota bacterium]